MTASSVRAPLLTPSLTHSHELRSYTSLLDYPIILTTYHLGLATVLTQIMARWTSVLDGRHNIKMTPQVYVRAIVPIGVTFSLSLICGNLTYLYLSVAFIQMLKVRPPSTSCPARSYHRALTHHRLRHQLPSSSRAGS